jgi:hypothetical protein
VEGGASWWFIYAVLANLGREITDRLGAAPLLSRIRRSLSVRLVNWTIPLCRKRPLPIGEHHVLYLMYIRSTGSYMQFNLIL